MKHASQGLRSEEIIRMARNARLMIEDGEFCYLNETATEKELIAFVRLVEAALNRISLSGHTPDTLNLDRA